MAAVGCKEYESVSDAVEKLIKIVDTVEPEEELVEKYEIQYQKFRQIYPSVKGLFQEL